MPRRPADLISSWLRGVTTWLSREPGVWLVIAGACGSALVAGTLPELLKLFPGGNITLAVIAILGLLVLTIAWTALNVRTRFGVVIFLSTTPDDLAQNLRMQGFVDRHRDKHLKLFYVNGNYLAPTADRDARITLAQRVMQERLSEESAWQVGSIDFYLRCDFPSAYQLARVTLGRGDDNAMPFGGLGRIRIHQFDHGSTTLEDDVIELTHHRWVLQPATSPAPQGVRVTGYQPIGKPRLELQNRCAIVVNLFGDPASIAKARRAANGGDPSTGYVVEDRDRCGGEILIEASLNTEPAVSHQAIVAAVVNEWEKFVKSRDDASRAQGRLFVHGPVAIVFALGALLPNSVELVPYVPR